MARIESRKTQRCACKHDCPAKAEITQWSCGKVEVEIINDRNPGDDCTNFSGMRRGCRCRNHPD